MRIEEIHGYPYGTKKTEIRMIVGVPYTQLAGTLAEAADKPYEAEIKPYKAKRSLDANSYYWVLLDRLKGFINTSREELHEQMLSRYGVLDRWDDGSLKAFPLLEELDAHEFVKYAEVYRVDEMRGRKVRWWRVLKPSSEMNTKEFSVLLDGLISECQECGIETATPEELARMAGYEVSQQKDSNGRGRDF